MSIDRRLREGLRASADALTPDPVVALHTVERKTQRQSSSHVHFWLGMKTLGVGEGQFRASGSPLPNLVQVQVTRIPQSSLFGKGDPDAHDCQTVTATLVLVILGG